MDIIEFLEARIREEQERAEYAALHFPTPSKWWDFTQTLRSAATDDPRAGQALRHVDSHSPSRVLTECAAKRAVIREHQGMVEGIDKLSQSRDPSLNADPDAPWRTATLRALASVYADHPDYQTEWAIGG